MRAGVSPVACSDHREPLFWMLDENIRECFGITARLLLCARGTQSLL